MKKVIALLFLSISILSCDDGDIIVTDFDFDDVTLQFCEGPDEDDEDEELQYVFFKINTANESIALNFTTDLPILTEQSEDSDDANDDGNYEIELSGDDQVVYRRFDSEITSDYYCNAIPPSTPGVLEELISTSGVITIRTSGDFDDNDGIPAEIEDPDGFDATNIADMLDTDNDGIPNIYDDDDDGDNVPTSLEGVVLTDDGSIDIENSRNTDSDEFLNYLDPDDDGDGVLTRNEDANGNLDPTDDNSNPDNPGEDDYRNSDIAVENIINMYREHIVIFENIELAMDINNLTFSNEDSTQETIIESNTFITLGIFTATSDDPVEIPIIPEFN